MCVTQLSHHFQPPLGATQETPVCRPGDLVSGTAEIRATFPDAALLQGRLCGLVAGPEA